MILLGSRSVGKTSVANAIFGIKAQESGKRTAHSVAQQGARGKTEITVVDTPGWWKGFAASDTPEAIKDELRLSVFLCPPGPHVFLVVVDADASFNANHLEAVTTHVELLGKGVWRRTMVIFTRGDWLGTHTIEEYIEGEGEALQSLIELCENRYHVIDNKNPDDGTQITELLEKITGTAAGNGSDCFIPDKQIFLDIEERRRRVEEGAGRRKIGVKTKRKGLAGMVQSPLVLVSTSLEFFNSSVQIGQFHKIDNKQVKSIYSPEVCRLSSWPYHFPRGKKSK